MTTRISISPVCRHYLAGEDGKTFLPVGANLCFFRDSERHPEEEVLATYERWLTLFARNGGNFARIWLGVPFFDVMPVKPGVFSAANRDHILFVIRLAERLGIKLKFTLEHFRRILPRTDAEIFPGAARFDKPLYLPLAATITDYYRSPECRELYLEKLRFLADAGAADSPAVAAWELWNEINASDAAPPVWAEWSRKMTGVLKERYPRQLILQNIARSHTPELSVIDRELLQLEPEGFRKIHRYYDPGSYYPLLQREMDVIAAESVRELRLETPERPAILAESGAVEAHHKSYSRHYEEDAEGTILHDILFAPFFAGGAGSGQPWHWDHLYIDRHDLWHHFDRFRKAVAGVDPAAEDFRPQSYETAEVRIYGLRGRNTSLYWVRDKHSSLQKKFIERLPPRLCEGVELALPPDLRYRCYDPWLDREEELSAQNNRVRLPPFRHSLVIRAQRYSQISS